MEKEDRSKVTTVTVTEHDIIELPMAKKDRTSKMLSTNILKT